MIKKEALPDALPITPFVVDIHVFLGRQTILGASISHRSIHDGHSGAVKAKWNVAG